jgi:hypothetical protein
MKNVSSWQKTGQKSIFYPRDAHILAQLDIMVLYTMFLRSWKYQILAQNPKGLALGLPTNIYLWWTQVENPYFIPLKPIFLLS